MPEDSTSTPHDGGASRWGRVRSRLPKAVGKLFEQECLTFLPCNLDRHSGIGQGREAEIVIGRHRSEQRHLSPKLERSANKHEHAQRDDGEHGRASRNDQLKPTPPDEDRFFWKQLIGHCTPHDYTLIWENKPIKSVHFMFLMRVAGETRCTRQHQRCRRRTFDRVHTRAQRPTELGFLKLRFGGGGGSGIKRRVACNQR